MRQSILQLDEKGNIKRCCISGRELPFRQDEYAGFQPYLILRGKKYEIPMRQKADFVSEGTFGSLDFRLEYECNEGLTVRLRVINKGEGAFKPTTLALRTGIDCYMEKYPEWNQRFFPTLLRCENTHFWGYNEMPDGTVLAYVSEDPAASWSNSYNELKSREDLCGYLAGGHRIYTWNIHLINRAPKPERHPQMEELLPGEAQEFTIHFKVTDDVRQVPHLIAEISKIPVLQFECYTLETGSCFYGKVWNAEKVWVKKPDGTERELEISENGTLCVDDTDLVGVYEINALSEEGKKAQALLYIRRETSWYLYQAREAVLKNRPLHTHHVESFNSLYTVELARKYLPDEKKDKELEQDFLEISGKLYDARKRMAAENPWRIQDSAAMSALFACRYTITEDKEDLKKAGYLADYLISCQKEDGAYYSIRSAEEQTHYTAVTYIAKYMMDTAEVEKQAANRWPEFKECANRHFESAKRAVEELVRNKDNIDTEGELTFEDGMISCSILQIAYMALNMDEENKKAEYIQAAEEMYKLHECLTQKLIPDCRMNGGTLRFWEAQYNLHIFHNMMNSPCGWTAWKIYGVWYLYLLTGKKKYLADMMNGLGACLQLVDKDSGTLRWGFICDPYVETLRYVFNEGGGNDGKLIDDIVCEQYVDMVSPWHRKEIFPRKKWGIDNLVHEIFKCLAEVGLLYALIYEEEDGRFLTWNCHAERNGEGIEVVITDQLAEALHCNLRERAHVAVPKYAVEGEIQKGWMLLAEKK